MTLRTQLAAGHATEVVKRGDVVRRAIVLEDGVTALEYAILAALIMVAIASSVGELGTGVTALFAQVQNFFGGL